MRNYSFDEALVIVREMTDNLVLDLFEKGLVTTLSPYGSPMTTGMSMRHPKEP